MWLFFLFWSGHVVPAFSWKALKFSLVFHCFTCKWLQRIHSVDLVLCLLCMICWRSIPMGRYYCFLADLVAPLGLWKMVLESLTGFQFNLHVFPLFTSIFRISCPKDYQVSKIDHFSSWYWGVSSFCKLHYFYNFSKRFTIGSMRNHYWFILCSLSSIYMGDMVTWSS